MYKVLEKCFCGKAKKYIVEFVAKYPNFQQVKTEH